MSPLAGKCDRGSGGEADLVGYVWSSVCDVSTSFCKDSLVIVTVEEGVLNLFYRTPSVWVPHVVRRTARDLVGLETRLLEHHDEPTRVCLRSGRLWDCGLDRNHGRTSGCSISDGHCP